MHAEAPDLHVFKAVRYVPPGCPACRRAFKEPGTDYVVYPGFRGDRESGERLLSHVRLLEGACLPGTEEVPERRFSAELLRCACGNITVAVTTGERMVETRADAERLCAEAGYTSIHTVRTLGDGYRVAREHLERQWGPIEIPGL